MKRKENPNQEAKSEKKVKQNGFFDDEIQFSPPATMNFDDPSLSQNLENSTIMEDDHGFDGLNGSGIGSQTTTLTQENQNGMIEFSQDFTDGTPASPIRSPKSTSLNTQATPIKSNGTTNGDKKASNASSNSAKKEKKPSAVDKQKLKELVEKERQLLLSQLSGNSKENKLLYEAFNNLQTVANEHKLKFDAPELVVVGMQSDGKSSFVEALLGFQFNTVDTQIGTRRPLILQMVNDPSCEKPLCHFFKESATSEIEEESTPVPELEREIRKRTEEVCGKGNVSSRPIVLRVRYKYCANLTIYDTPGFRKGESDPLCERIYKTVMNLIKPQNRIIVALEQSTVEWCNTQVRPYIKKVDPNFERTIFVVTKFNNRNNQFRDGKEANDYLATDGHIQDTSKVFYVSLPSGHGTRNLAEEEFKNEIVSTYLKDYKKLTKVGFDEKKYKTQLGFFNLKRFLERLLNEKYVANISPVLSSLEILLSKRKQQLGKVTSELDEIEKENIESQITHMIGAYVNNITKALNGTNQFDTLKNGFTLEEERASSGVDNWPGFSQQIQDKLPIRNRTFKLYGGAQLERLLSEFEVVSHAQEFPHTTNDEVAVSIGVNPMHTSPDYIRGVTDLAQKKCRMVFKPLIECLLQRSRFIMNQLFKLIILYMIKNNHLSSRYKTFSSELFKVCEEFIETVLKDVRTKTSDEFETFVKIMDWDLVATTSTPKKVTEYDLLHPKEEDTIERVKNILDDSNDSLYVAFEQFKGRELTDEKCEKIKKVAAQLFAGVRSMFVKYIRAKFNAFFLDPIFTNMDNYIRVHFFNMGTDKLRELMGHRVVQLKAAKEAYADQVKKLSQHKEMFMTLSDKFQNASTTSSVTSTTTNGSKSSTPAVANSTPVKKVSSSTNGHHTPKTAPQSTGKQEKNKQ